MSFEHGIYTVPTGKSSLLRRPLELLDPEEKGHSDLNKMSVTA